MTGTSSGNLRYTFMLRTVPTLTPRRVTGAPTSRPATESWKNTTTRRLLVNSLVPPNARMATTPSAAPPRIKAPTAVDLLSAIGIFLQLILAGGPFPVHERMHGG